MGNTAIFEVTKLQLGRGSAGKQPLGFALSAGQWCKLTGENGSGKTTLLRVLCGLSEPLAGRVCWQGSPITYHRLSYHHSIIYIGHKFGFRGGLSVAENLEFYCALAGRHGRYNLGQAMEYFKISDLSQRPYAALSHGQQQRVALCRLILEKARLWLLDEPTSALDRPGHDSFQDLLVKHISNGGTAVVATHKPFEHQALQDAHCLRLNDYL
ncbi:MAG: heme ABC exporter ATP-binding protein CcmA [Chromatiales bacterium]|nr:heme ABC exporter ATP-binding protein CcmA [Chromatiales bacterium]